MSELLNALVWLHSVATVENDKDYAAITNAAAVIERAASAKRDERKTQTYVFLKPGDVIQATDERYSPAYLKWKSIAPLYVGSIVGASTQPVRRSAQQVQADAGAVAKDAERYRWLRSDDIEVLPGWREICVYMERLPHTDESDVLLTGSDLDSAIDTCIAAMSNDTKDSNG